MTALQDLLAKVEAGDYRRPNGGPMRYNAFWNELEQAGVDVTSRVMLQLNLRDGTASDFLRALIAQEGEA